MGVLSGNLRHDTERENRYIIRMASCVFMYIDCVSMDHGILGQPSRCPEKMNGILLFDWPSLNVEMPSGPSNPNGASAYLAEYPHGTGRTPYSPFHR